MIGARDDGALIDVGKLPARIIDDDDLCAQGDIPDVAGKGGATELLLHQTGFDVDIVTRIRPGLNQRKRLNACLRVFRNIGYYDRTADTDKTSKCTLSDRGIKTELLLRADIDVITCGDASLQPNLRPGGAGHRLIEIA